MIKFNKLLFAFLLCFSVVILSGCGKKQQLNNKKALEPGSIKVEENNKQPDRLQPISDSAEKTPVKDEKEKKDIKSMLEKLQKEKDSASLDVNEDDFEVDAGDIDESDIVEEEIDEDVDDSDIDSL